MSSIGCVVWLQLRRCLILTINLALTLILALTLTVCKEANPRSKDINFYERANCSSKGANSRFNDTNFQY